MEKLSETWFVEGLIDLEYKKYTLLSYLQKTEEKFQVEILYPVFSDLVFHYKNLLNFRESKKIFKSSFPKKITGLNLKELKLEKESLIQDSENLNEIEKIIDYSIPQFHRTIDKGKNLFDSIDQDLKFEPIGLLPIYKKEGYLLFNRTKKKKIDVYSYKTTLIKESFQTWKGVSIEFFKSFQSSLSENFEGVKHHLIKENKKLPNPATFGLTLSREYPWMESTLPVVKRKFLFFLNGLIG